MLRSDCLDAAAAWFDEGHFFDVLQRRVALRTESDTGKPNPALADYLRGEMSDSLRALGFACSVMPNPVEGAGPFLVARRVEDTALPTVLTYGHGDVVSGQEGQIGRAHV